MAWIESHQALSKHKKTLALTALLKTDRHKVLGHLHELWWWGIDNADTNGQLGAVPAEVIAEAAGWPISKAPAFVIALVASGFVDETDDGLVLHDWYDYAGKLNARRDENRERMRRKRDTPPPHNPPTNGARAAHVQRTNGARAEQVLDTSGACAPATVHNPTGPNRTQQKRTGDVTPPSTTSTPPREATAAFSDEEQSQIDSVGQVLAPFGISADPLLWRKVLDSYGALDLEAEALKQADWMRRHRIRACSSSRYLNWLAKARADQPQSLELEDLAAILPQPPRTWLTCSKCGREGYSEFADPPLCSGCGDVAAGSRRPARAEAA